MADYSLIVTAWADAARPICTIRRQVFILEQGVAEYEEWDQADAAAVHVLAVHKKRDAVGTGRLEPSGKVGRVAVVSAHRGRGVGAQLMRRLIEEARALDTNPVYLNAQTQAVAFYRQVGFTSVGDTFMEAGIPHVRMEQRLEPDSHAER